MNRFIVPVIALIAGVGIGYTLLPANAPQGEGSTIAPNEGEQDILYWVAPMDSSYRRDKPGKSPMGMDLVPVYAGEANTTPGTVSIAPQIVQSLGVTTAKARTRSLSEAVAASGIVEVAEDRIIHVHPRVSGWVERLTVTTDGQPVTQGNTLYTLYSPELVNAQEEYLLARSRNNQSLINAARDRLTALQLPPKVIQNLDKTGNVQQQIAFEVPQDGYVTNLNIRPGFYVTPGTTMLAIASLQTVWITASIPQRYADMLSTEQDLNITLPALPGETFSARVDFIYPELDNKTRTLKVRLVLDNPDGRLKPNMFATVSFDTPRNESLSIPRSALIRTAANDRVVLALGNGEFRSTAVAVGRITADYAEITAGLEEGDEVVMNGLFLIDSESAVDADLSRISGEEDSQSNDTQWVTLTIDAIDSETGTVTASHGPVAAWDWPAMTMDFAIGEQVNLAEINSGIRLDAELNRNTDGMVEIIAIDTDSIESSIPSATADGTINSIDEQNHVMNISRGAIEKWGRDPATMDFTLSNHMATTDWQPGQTIRFTFEIRDGEFVITHIEPAMAMSHDMDHAGH